MSTFNLNPVNILIYGNVPSTLRTSPGTTCSELHSGLYGLMNVAMSTGDVRERRERMRVRGEVWTTRRSGRDSLGLLLGLSGLQKSIVIWLSTLIFR